jgi:hypothetical protein
VGGAPKSVRGGVSPLGRPDQSEDTTDRLANLARSANADNRHYTGTAIKYEVRERLMGQSAGRNPLRFLGGQAVSVRPTALRPDLAIGLP